MATSRPETDHPHRSLRDRFVDFSKAASNVVGSHWAFAIALVVIVIWGITGPFFHYSDTWQLIINTGTTIVTFLMVFLIQSTQNRDAKAIHLKLDELIRALGGARNDLVLLENMSEDELNKLAEDFKHLHDRACDHVKKRQAKRASKTTSVAPAEPIPVDSRS